MAIISFDKDFVIDYLPEFGDNRESEDPCVVRLKFLPYSRVQHYTRIIAGKTKDLTDTSKITEIAQGIQRQQFIENVESVSNYYVNGKEVRDPGEFYDTADGKLVTEILRAMENSARLSEGQRKN